MGTRNNSIVGETTTLEFLLLQNQQPFDASSVRQVVIYPSYLDAVNNTNIIETIVAGSITHIGTGLYQYTAAAEAVAGTYFDKIFLTPVTGGLEKTFINSFTVVEYSSGVTAADVRAYLEGYCITTTQITDAWITARITNMVIPFVEEITRDSYTGIKQVTEYYSGNGDSVLMLNRKNVISIDDITLVTFSDYEFQLGLTNLFVLPDEGIIKSTGTFESFPFLTVFPRGINNLKIKYSYGHTTFPADVREAVTCFAAVMVLNFIGSRTGGGNLSAQGIGKTYGNRGKYTDIIVQLERYGHTILHKYTTSVVGQ